MNCQDCKHLVIVEDRSYGMRPPYAHCSIDKPIVNIAVMEWEPANKPCDGFVLGEPEYY